MLGVLLSLIVAVCYGISAAMQKYAISRMERFSFRRLFKNARWLAALLVGFVGTITYLLAVKIAPLSTVQVFLSLSIIIPILVGASLFKEYLRKSEWLCVCLILVGICLTII
jgi:multidrug transporter EmrE-like cation transporter